MNISPTEAEFFAIRCGISQAVCINNITNIVVVTDAISAAQKIFNTSCHLFQLYSIAISQDLRVFFSKNPRNSITFWDCPSNDKWPSHQLVDKESKTSKFHPILPSKTSWDYSRKEECDSILKKWQMYFQASDLRGRNFLDLNDDNDEPIQPSYSKGGSWLKHFSVSNSLCAQVTRLITNHAPIGKYRKRFFPNEPTSCPCGQAPLETRDHILYD